MESIKKTIKKYILENLLFTSDENSLSDDVSFMEAGIIDSTGILEIISYLEDKFHIKIEDDEVIPENMDTINNITNYLENKINVKIAN